MHQLTPNISGLSYLRSRWSRFALVVGPGFVVMLADTDAGSIITAAQSGAQWGYRLLLLQLVLILANQNAITYGEIFKLIKEDRLWLGYDNGGEKWFRVPDAYDHTTDKSKIKVEDGAGSSAKSER